MATATRKAPTRVDLARARVAAWRTAASRRAPTVTQWLGAAVVDYGVYHGWGRTAALLTAGGIIIVFGTLAESAESHRRDRRLAALETWKNRIEGGED